jgi:endonuclease YncB( thermonuclease family)
MAALLALLATVTGVLKSIVAALPPIAWLCLLILAIGFYYGYGCRPVPPPEPPRIVEYDVAAVVDGSHLLLSYGLAGRRQAGVTLLGIESPESVAAAAESNLEALAGERVGVEVDRLIGDEQTEGGTAIRPPPSSAIVHAMTGQVLQEAQIEAGMARCVGQVPKSWTKAEASAKKAKRGLWAGE